MEGTTKIAVQTCVCVRERERKKEREREMVYYAKGRWVRECDAFFELIE